MMPDKPDKQGFKLSVKRTFREFISGENVPGVLTMTGFIGYRFLGLDLGFSSERIFSKPKEINELAASRHFPTFLDPILKIEFHF